MRFMAFFRGFRRYQRNSRGLSGKVQRRSTGTRKRFIGISGGCQSFSGSFIGLWRGLSEVLGDFGGVFGCSRCFIRAHRASGELLVSSGVSMHFEKFPGLWGLNRISGQVSFMLVLHTRFRRFLKHFRGRGISRNFKEHQSFQAWRNFSFRSVFEGCFQKGFKPFQSVFVDIRGLKVSGKLQKQSSVVSELFEGVSVHSGGFIGFQVYFRRFRGDLRHFRGVSGSLWMFQNDYTRRFGSI